MNSTITELNIIYETHGYLECKSAYEKMDNNFHILSDWDLIEIKLFMAKLALINKDMVFLQSFFNIGILPSEKEELISLRNEITKNKMEKSQSSKINKIGKSQSSKINKMEKSQSSKINKMEKSQSSKINKMEKSQSSKINKIGKSQSSKINKGMKYYCNKCNKHYDKATFGDTCPHCGNIMSRNW